MNLKQLRKQHSITQATAAKLVYCSRRNWIRMEQGDQQISRAQIALLTLRLHPNERFRTSVEYKLRNI